MSGPPDSRGRPESAFYTLPATRYTLHAACLFPLAILRPGATLLHLDRILAQTRADLAERRKRATLALLEKAATQHPPRGFAQTLRAEAAKGPAIIAELKKASP